MVMGSAAFSSPKTGSAFLGPFDSFAKHSGRLFSSPVWDYAVSFPFAFPLFFVKATVIGISISFVSRTREIAFPC